MLLRFFVKFYSFERCFSFCYNVRCNIRQTRSYGDMKMEKINKVTSSVIDILSEQGTDLQGSRIYGKAQEVPHEEKKDYQILRLSNETGNGVITAYQVFSGIELYYNDMHMGYCNKEQKTVKNVIEINHCRIGRFECSFGENSCCYMTEGDLAISSLMKKKSEACFPLRHYHGITILIDLDRVLPDIRRIMELLNIDLDYIKKYICEENRCCIMRANPSVEHIFSELYCVKEKRKAGYIKIKTLELLLFLSDLNTKEEILHMEYFNSSQVNLMKNVETYITKDLTKHYTIEQISHEFEISDSALKKNFKGVYGTSIYSYLRTYRLQTAEKLLRETELSVTEIASDIGYENPNKFTSAFKEMYGIPPTLYRKRIYLDRNGTSRSGEEV